MLAEEVVTIVLYLYLTISSGRADWVEISQNGYRRGFKPPSTRNSLLTDGSHTPSPTAFSARLSSSPTPIQVDHDFVRGVNRFDFEVIHDFDVPRYDSNVSVSMLKRKKLFRHQVNIASVERVLQNVPEVLSTIGESGSTGDGPEYLSGELFNGKTKQSNLRKVDNVSSQEIGSTEEVVGKINIKLAPNLEEKDDISMEESHGEKAELHNDENITGNATVQNAKTDHFKTISGIIKILKLVQDTISKKSHRTVQGKMKYLQELGDAIMFNIKDRVEALWPADGGGAGRAAGGAGRARAVRSSREADHVHFPSAESALMSISFLTFAVFLIKLVMQVIQTYKAKAMMVTPVFTAVSRAVLGTSHEPHL